MVELQVVVRDLLSLLDSSYSPSIEVAPGHLTNSRPKGKLPSLLAPFANFQIGGHSFPFWREQTQKEGLPFSPKVSFG